MNIPFSDEEKEKSAPVLPICYICGRQFGTKSILLHEPKCMEKWEKEQAKLPKEKRLPRPVRPQFLQQLETSLENTHISPTSGSGKSPEELQENMRQYNEAAMNTFQEQSRVSCPHCQRKFAQDRLEVHLRSCKPDGFFSKHSIRNNTLKEKEDQGKNSTPSAIVDTQVSLNNGTQKKAITSPAKSTSPTKSSSSTNSKQENPAPPLPSVFCTECGTKYTTNTAKFCGKCGAKRDLLDTSN